LGIGIRLGTILKIIKIKNYRRIMKKSTIFTNLQANGHLTSKTVATTVTTAGAVTHTASAVVGGLILRDPNGAGRSDLFPTAANIYQALGASPKYIGQSFDVHIRNTADANETITMTTNTGLTLSGTMTIAQNNAKTFRVVLTSPTTATIYSLGTVVF
jgi:hypothetical protein